MSQIIVITATDTDAGKTMLTGLLLQHLRGKGIHALATKPFCSGSLDDVNFLQELQNHELSQEEANPWFFQEPVAPRAAMLKKRVNVSLKQVVKHITKLAQRCEILLVEGAGGLLAPLGKNYSLRDVIQHLDCEVVVVGKNKLGCINHLALVCNALNACNLQRTTIVLNGVEKPDISSETNRELILEVIGGAANVYEVPFLGKKATNARKISALEKQCWGAMEKIAKSFLVAGKGSKKKNFGKFGGSKTRETEKK